MLTPNTTITVNLKNLKNNINNIRDFVGWKTKFLFPVKANGYGHDILEVAKFTQNKNLVDYFGVASIKEGVDLRKSGIIQPILVMGYSQKKHIKYAVENDLEIVICENEILNELELQAKKQNKKAKVHVKVDTGMGRMGIVFKDAFEFIQKVASNKYLDLIGIMSHFAVSDEENGKKFTEFQLKNFLELKEQILKSRIKIKLFHTTNSGGVCFHPKSYLDMIRPGIMTYGYPPLEFDNSKLNLKPVLELKSKITIIKEYPKNHSLGYGRTYFTKKKTKIAIVPIGYGDGYDRHYSSNAEVVINEKKYPVVGRVSMDQIQINIDLDNNVKVGDEVILIGSQGKEKIDANDLAIRKKTIPYEVLCQLSPRQGLRKFKY